MHVLALDIGEARVGIAVSDREGKVASPVCVLPASEVHACASSFRRVLDAWEPTLLLVGLPLTLAGEQGPQARKIRTCAEELSAKLALPLAYTDERLSSIEAKRTLQEAGLSERKMRGKLDMLAASLFLQAWLDARSRKEQL